MNRKDFLKISGAASLGALLLPNSIYANRIKGEKIKTGVIGVGLRGQNHVNVLLQRGDVEVVAIADPDQRMIDRTLALYEKHKQPLPQVFKKGDYDYQNLLKREDIDAVIISTPWEWHKTQTLESMDAGKIVGLEVGGALTIEECWEYILKYEQTKIPLFVMENVCYRRDIMAVMNMARKGKFGELIHGQGGYQHDLRNVLFNDGEHPYGHGYEFGEKGFSEAQWRTDHHVNRNGDLYPTHGLGPIGTMFDINRGNRITHLTSMASKAIGLNHYVKKNAGEDHPNAKLSFKKGDIVQTMLACENGETILLTHDVSNQRPYNLGFRLQGVEGIWQDIGSGGFDQGFIYFEDEMEQSHQWANAQQHLEEYDHPYWKKYEDKATGAGHGGMDWFLINDFVECIKKNREFPFDVYDLATWYAVTPLSELSIKQGSTLQMMPDFTLGNYKKRKPVFGFEEYGV